MEVTLSIEAFSKVILHATKYPQLSINGVFLMKKGNDEGGGEKLHFVNAVPILHMAKHLAPMMELGLAQIEHYCLQHKLKIGGYYQANQNLNDNTPDFVAMRIADKLHDYNPHTIVVMLNNEELNSNLEVAPFRIYKMSEGKLKLRDARIILEPDMEGALSTASALIQAKAHRLLVDFDNHLDDINLPFITNDDLSDQIRQLSS